MYSALKYRSFLLAPVLEGAGASRALLHPTLIGNVSPLISPRMFWDTTLVLSSQVLTPRDSCMSACQAGSLLFLRGGSGVCWGSC